VGSHFVVESIARPGGSTTGFTNFAPSMVRKWLEMLKLIVPGQQATVMAAPRCRVLMVYPRFTAPSFWNVRATCELVGARYPNPPLGLITLAALLPSSWDVRLVDRNVEELTPADLDAADLVMTGGMFPQRNDTYAIIRMCKASQKPVAVGGPDVSSSPHLFAEADFQICGEAASIIGTFIEAWTSGKRHGVFEAEKFRADMTRSPIPRFDLLKFDRYAQLAVQYSRGCPFNCEFCDIIELYGRVPRTKTTQQMLAELDVLYRIGHRNQVFFVDDNFVGNKKELRRLLPVLIEWQRQRKYPFQFLTQATINLSDDPQLLEMMRQANFFMVFIGIESPDTNTLISMQKKQNTRRSLAASVDRLYAAGIAVTAGLIIGFDSENGSVADSMIECVDATSIPFTHLSLLSALANTQLSRRLQREGRLYSDAEAISHECISGLNFKTARPRRDILNDFERVLESIYQPSSYFERVRRMSRMLRRPNLGVAPLLRVIFNYLPTVVRLSWHFSIKHPELRQHFWNTVADCAVHNPRALPCALLMTAFYLDLGPLAEYAKQRAQHEIGLIDTGKWAEGVSSLMNA
jgi:radical SAM superfamily enzyme YgiQ (UPF0313 family)